MKNKTKNIIIGGLIILLICLCLIIYILLTKNDNKIREMTGTIIVSDSKYVIVEHNNEDYIISNIKGKYEVGDIVKFTYQESDLVLNEEPKRLKITDEELIKTKETSDNNITNNENNDVKENDTNSNNSESNNSSQNMSSSNNSNNNNVNNSGTSTVKPNTSTSVKNADDEVLSYFNKLNSDFNASSIKDSIKNGFITVVDFLFYNGKIMGHTFSELSDSAKLKVLSMALYFDSKIEKYFPGYKESISNTTTKIYTNIKEKVVKTYLELTTTICSKNSELCITAKEGFNDLKNTFSLSWALIKDIASDGLSSLKSWYEIWSGK